jgi:ABC-type lipoprotein release transport system permease subunit
MGRVLLVCRLAARDLRRRPAEAALLLLAIMAATTTLTLALVLHGVTSKPYQSTREATAGPDVMAGVVPPVVSGRPGAPPVFGDQPADLAGLNALASAPGVVGHSGPYPVVWTTLKAGGRTVNAQAEGRDRARARLDQPKLTQGRWVGDGGVVLEAAFADALDLGAGDPITVAGRSFQVAGVAVTAATSPYPDVSCLVICLPSGLVWLTQADARSLAPRGGSLAYVLNLKLADPARAPAFVDEHNPRQNASPGARASDPDAPLMYSWQDVNEANANLVRNQRRALLTGGWLLGLLAVASVAVLVGGRMADQIRRVGLLKAIGGTPSVIAAVLLAEYVVVALLAAAAGLAVGWLAAPLLADPSAGLLGRAGAPPLTLSAVGLVTAVALGVAVVATFVPAVRAARTSTVLALADSARAPQRTAWLIAISARLPVPLLLGLRVAGRRPRRIALAIVSIAITVSGIVGALAAHADLEQSMGSSVVDQSRTDRLNQVLLVITITLVALAAVNAIFITWATALDARRSSALARALGATPQQVSAGISASQVLPALAGAVLGIPGGLALFAAVDPDPGTVVPPLWQLVAVVVGTVLLVAGLTAIPARASGRRPAAEILQSELA